MHSVCVREGNRTQLNGDVMHYIHFEDGNDFSVQEFDVDTYISEIGGHHLCELYDSDVCAYSFEGCIAAGVVASHIIANTAALADLDSPFKQALQQAAILITMAERKGEWDVLPSAILSDYIAKLRESMLTGILETLLFSPDKFKVLHDTPISLGSVIRDAVRIALMITPAPRLHVHSDAVWTIVRYNVHMAAPILRSEVALALYRRLLPLWQDMLAVGGTKFVHPITAKILEQQKVIAGANAEIKALADTCTHPRSEVVQVRGGSSGNWSQSDDCETLTQTCKRCGRNWYFNKNHGDTEFELLSERQIMLPIKE